MQWYARSGHGTVTHPSIDVKYIKQGNKPYSTCARRGAVV